ncbi:hypothetical protein Tco_0524483, partial [Tanacetum coccineum]
TGKFMPPTPDLFFTGLDEFVNKPVVDNYDEEEEVSQPKIEKKTVVSQSKIEKKTVKSSFDNIEFVKSKPQRKTTRKTVKPVDCNYHQKQFQNKRMVKPVWNNAQRVNHQNFAKKTHSCVKRNMVPRAVLMKSGLVSINIARQNISKAAVLVNTARQVNVAHLKTIVNAARPMSYLSKTAHSTVKRLIHKNTTFKNSNINQMVNTVRGKKFNTARSKAVVNAIKGNNFNVVKASACWVWKPKNKVLDHGNPQIDLQDQGMEDMLLLEETPKERKSQELSSHDDGSKPPSDDGKKVDEDPKKESECKDQEKVDNVNSTNNVNIVSSTVNVADTNEVNVVGGNMSIELPFDPKMLALEDDSIFSQVLD